MYKSFAIIALAGYVSACGTTWVQLTSAGRLVTVATPAEITNCTRVGTSTANAISSIAFIERGNNKMQSELIDLARNEAGDMGGNRIVTESPIVDGRQTFGVYRCGN